MTDIPKFPKYEKSDFKNISWEEYGKTLEVLYDKIHDYLGKNRLKIDAVVPILRGGAFSGTYLAYKFHVIRIFPVQYKYLYEDKFELKRISSVSSDAFDRSSSPIILLVENNHCFGTTAKEALKDLKEVIPNAKVLYAAAYMDYSNQEMPGTEAVFYGQLTNEARGLAKEQADEKEITNDLSLFPWEDIEEEWAMVQGKKFDYK